MDKDQFLQTLGAEYRRWETLLAKVDENDAYRPGVAGPWSIADILAHVTWFESEMLDLIQRRTLDGSDLWMLPPDERNAAIYNQNRDRTLTDVLEGARSVHQQLVEALEDLPEEHYGNPRRFQNMPADWVPWQVLAGNTYEHYRDHIPDIRAILDE